MPEQVINERQGGAWTLAAGVGLAPLAWAADLLIGYALVHHACSTGHFYVLHVTSALCLLVALTGAWLAWQQFLKARGGSEEGNSVIDRTYFVALAGVALSIGFALVILAAAVPRLVLSPCD